MSRAPFRLAPFDAAYDRAGFNSDSEPLNRYLREQVTQDIRRRVAACFVALASASLLLADLPATSVLDAANFSVRLFADLYPTRAHEIPTTTKGGYSPYDQYDFASTTATPVGRNQSRREFS